MILSTFALARKLRRVPIADEAVAYYEACELNTGVDVSGQRLRRAKKAVAECAKTFDADKATPHSERTDFRDHLPLIRARISEDDLRAASPDRQVLTHNDVCLLYEAMTFAILHDDSPYGWPQLGKAWAKKVFDEKKQRGEHPTGCNHRKFRALHRLLSDADLIVEAIEPIATQRCRSWKLGNAHPLNTGEAAA